MAALVVERFPALQHRLVDARAVGKLTVEQVLARASARLVADAGPLLVRSADSPPGATEPDLSAEKPAQPESATSRPTVDPPSAIADYASLAASQVVPRLKALTRTELAEVEVYESATRRRRTILAAIGRLSS